jgi:hypothetical protein
VLKKTEVLPGSQLFPSLGLELLGIFAIDILSSMHHVYLIVHRLTLFNKDRGFAIWTTANRNCCVANGSAPIYRDDGMQSQSFGKLVLVLQTTIGKLTLIQTVLKVLHALDLFK